MIWIVLAVLLLLIAALLIVAAVLEGAVPVAIDPAGISVDTTVSGVFVTGIVTGLLVLGGIAALLVGIHQVRAHRREVEYLRQRVAEQDRLAQPAASAHTGKATRSDSPSEGAKPPQEGATADAKSQDDTQTGGSSRREKRRNDRSATDVSAR